jgi:hypothetical protein
MVHAALHLMVTVLPRPQRVTTGLILPWRRGPGEGHVNRMKVFEQQMFG